MTREEAADNIGREVVWTRTDGHEERGVITGVSSRHWVFVRYGTDPHSKATEPSWLKFAEVSA